MYLLTYLQTCLIVISVVLSLSYFPPQFDVDLAKEVAGRQMHDDSLQKKLWLRIAKHVIEEEQNINQ